MDATPGPAVEAVRQAKSMKFTRFVKLSGMTNAEARRLAQAESLLIVRQRNVGTEYVCIPGQEHKFDVD